MEKQADQKKEWNVNNVDKSIRNELMRLIEENRKENSARPIFYTNLSYEEFQKMIKIKNEKLKIKKNEQG